MPTYDGTILDNGGAVYNVRSAAFGAVGNGVADDTAALQAAVNAAAATGGTVLIPPGTYIVGTVVLAVGVTISGYGAVLKRPSFVLTSGSTGREDYFRTLHIPDTGPESWNSASDSPRITILGLTIDGNSANQGVYRGFEQEHSSCIFISANPASAGRVRCTMRDVIVRNSVADGISIHTNAEVQISDCRADDCFRGGVVITGGHTVVEVQNLRTTGRVDPTGIDVEVDTAGYNGNVAVDVTLDGLVLDGDFDLIMLAGSTVSATNVISGSGFYLGARDSTVRIANSRFVLGAFGAESNRIVTPHDVTFQNVVFEVAGVTEAGSVDAAAAHIYWNVSSAETGQRCRFLDCEFRVAPGVASGLNLVGIYTEPDLLTQDNRLIVEGGSISGEFDTGLLMAQGGRWIIKETEIAAGTGIDFNGQVAFGQQTLADIRLERIVFTGATRYLNVAAAAAANVVDHRDVVMAEAKNVITTAYGLAGTFVGGRLIRVTSNPDGRIPGLPGDRARLAAPVAGSAYEWVCTAGSETAATWKTVATLAA